MEGIRYSLNGSEAGVRRGCDLVTIVALTIPALTAGTAGSYRLDWDWATRATTITIDDFRAPIDPVLNPQDVVYALSAAQLLSNIRDVFGLKMSEVAQIFGVSRRAAYDWLEGALPKTEIVAKMDKLSKQADEFRSAGITRLEHFTHRPVIGGRSLIDMLKSNEDIETALAIIKKTALDEARIRVDSGGRSAESKAGAHGLDEVSTPIVS